MSTHTDPAFMSSRTLHIEERAEQQYQRRVRERLQELLDSDLELGELILDYVHVFLPELISLARDADPDNGYYVHKAIQRLARYRAQHLTPDKGDGDYE